MYNRFKEAYARVRQSFADIRRNVERWRDAVLHSVSSLFEPVMSVDSTNNELIGHANMLTSPCTVQYSTYLYRHFLCGYVVHGFRDRRGIL